MQPLDRAREEMGAPELAALVRAIADAIEDGDSWEGNIEYLPGEEKQFSVLGTVRTGNLMGQGGVTFIGGFA